MNRGMRLQNYQRTFLRVNPSSASFSSFRFLSPPFLPFLLLRRSRYGSVDESLEDRNGNNLSIHLSMRDEIINEFVKGIIQRKIVVTRQDICCFYFFAVCPPYSSGIK